MFPWGVLHVQIGVIVDATPFYAESGGQTFDTGYLNVVDASASKTDDDEDAVAPALATIAVTNVQSFAGFVLHVGTVERGTIRVGDSVRCEVDYDRRTDIAPNHTMTHALNYALRKVLGHTPEKPVEQKGSFVAAERLRFDFSYNKGLTQEQLTEVDAIVTKTINAALPVYHDVVPLARARAVHSLCAVFGETYPDPVRVISIGVPVDRLVSDPENAEWGAYSVELCGGTHINHTSQAGAFAVIEETAIAKGIRRIVAVTRQAALDAMGAAEALRDDFGAARALPVEALSKAILDLTEKLNNAVIPAAAKLELRGQLADLQARSLAAWKEGQRVRTEAAVAAANAAAEEAQKRAVASGKPGFVVVEVCWVAVSWFVRLLTVDCQLTCVVAMVCAG